jgi:hypothetical protein
VSIVNKLSSLLTLYSSSPSSLERAMTNLSSYATKCSSDDITMP